MKFNIHFLLNRHQIIISHISVRLNSHSKELFKSEHVYICANFIQIMKFNTTNTLNEFKVDNSILLTTSIPFTTHSSTSYINYVIRYNYRIYELKAHNTTKILKFSIFHRNAIYGAQICSTI